MLLKCDSAKSITNTLYFNRKLLLVTLLVLFLVYCAYLSSTCTSNEIPKKDAVVHLYSASSEFNFVPAEDEGATITPAQHGRTRSCANELSQFYSSTGLEENRRLPSALIIGVKKSGTRALLEFIRFHPDVRGSGCELHFFDRHYSKGLDWYRHHMPPTHRGQVTIEKSPSYFITREVPKRVFQMDPKMKLLLVVRDPVTRAISDYTQAVTKMTTDRKFEELAFVSGRRGSVDLIFEP